MFDGLDACAIVVYNSDDDNSGEVLKDCKAKSYSYGTISGSDFLIKQIEYDFNGTSFIINHDATDYKITTSLVGEFNAYNATAAFAITKLHGLKEDQIIKGIKTTPQVPGRFEVMCKEIKKVIILQNGYFLFASITESLNHFFTLTLLLFNSLRNFFFCTSEIGEPLLSNRPTCFFVFSLIPAIVVPFVIPAHAPGVFHYYPFYFRLRYHCL